MRYAQTTLAHYWRDSFLRGATHVNLLPANVTCSQSGTTVTITAAGSGFDASFARYHIGCMIKWSTGEIAIIRDTGSISGNSTTCTVDRSQTVASGAAVVSRKPFVCADYGDSMGQSWPMFAAAMYRALGFGGSIFRPNNIEANSGLEYQSVTLSGGAAESTTTSDYATLPCSTCWSIPVGGTVEIELTNPLPAGVTTQRTCRDGLRPEQKQTDTFTLCWIRAAGSLTLLRKLRSDTSWATVATIDTSTGGSGTYGTYRCAHDMSSEWQYQWTNGGATTVKVVQAAFWNLTTPGFVMWPYWRGSIAGNNDMASDATIGASNLGELCTHNFQPDMRLITFYDGQTGQTSTAYYTSELTTDRTVWAAAAPRMDHVYVGLYQWSNIQAPETVRQQAIRTFALANGDAYINFDVLAGPWSTGSILGLQVDGQHPSYTGNALMAAYLWRLIGMDHPGLASPRDVNARYVDTDVLRVKGNDIQAQITTIKLASRRVRRGAKWSYAANGTTSNGGYLVGAGALSAAIGSGDFTFTIDAEFDASVDRYIASVSASFMPGSGLFQNSAVLIRQTFTEMRVYLIDASGNQYAYRWTNWAYTGRHTLTVRSNRSGGNFELFIDGALARALTPATATGTTPTLATWTGVGTDIWSPQASTDASSNYVYGMAMWLSRLSDAEIAANDLAGGPTTTTPEFWWDFGEGCGRQTFSRLGNTNATGVWLGGNPSQYSIGSGPAWLEGKQDLARPFKATLGATTVLLPNEQWIAAYPAARDMQLPAAPAVGDRVVVTRAGSAGGGAVRFSQPALHQIITGAGATPGTDKTTIGTGGFLSLASNYGSATLRCTRADGGTAYEWVIEASSGTLTFT